jgi:putative ABC transport system permease protein
VLDIPVSAHDFNLRKQRMPPLAVSGLLSAQLFGVSGRDPRVYAAVALLILVVALLASALPMLRATRANPLDALRMPQ